MPHFYFDIDDWTDHLPDTEGTEYADLQTACCESPNGISGDWFG